MMASRGMGAIRESKVPKIVKKRDGNEPVEIFKEGGQVWDQPRPKGLGKPKKLSPAKKAKAKEFAKKTGTKYPSLVANMHGAKYGSKG